MKLYLAQLHKELVLGLSLVLASTSTEARTIDITENRAIFVAGRTNDGSRLFIDIVKQPKYNPSTGLTHFIYGVQDHQGYYRTHEASTWWCHQGLVIKNPNYKWTNGLTDKTPAWIVDSLEVGGEAPIVTADSNASINLLRAVCATAN